MQNSDSGTKEPKHPAQPKPGAVPSKAAGGAAKKTVESTPRARATFRDRVVGLARPSPARLHDHPENWRMHPEAQRDFLRAVLGDIGIAGAAVAIVADEARRVELARMPEDQRAAWLAAYDGPLMLIDGHLRKAEIAQPIPTVVVDLSPEEARRALATHDTAGAMAETDVAKLRAIVEGSGFEGSVLERLRAVVGPEVRPVDDDEEEPVIPTDALVLKWQTAPGQLWVVPSLTVPGREHRLLCGDCRDPANVERLHEGARPDLGLHDGPYGIAIVSDTGSTLGDGRPIAKPLGNGERTRGGNLGNGEQARTEWTRRGKFAPIEGDAGDFDARHLLGTAERVVLWGANNFPGSLPPSNTWIVWDKKATADGGSIASNSFSDAELAFVSPKVGETGHTRTIRHLWSGLIRASERTEKRLHPTQKPIAVQRQIVEWYSAPGDLVADWYMGAGAVIIACEQTGRIGHGMDIAHAYLAATLERLSTRGLVPRLAT